MIKIIEVRDHCHFTDKNTGAAHSICNLGFNVHNKIPVVFHNGSNYDYHFNVKESVNEFQGKFESLGEIQKSTKLFLFQ